MEGAPYLLGMSYMENLDVKENICVTNIPMGSSSETTWANSNDKLVEPEANLEQPPQHQLTRIVKRLAWIQDFILDRGKKRLPTNKWTALNG